MSDLIKAITEWPIIIQGALGSGLFWLIFTIGQKSVKTCSKLCSKYSLGREENYLNNQRDKYIGHLAHLNGNYEEAKYVAIGLIYRSLRALFMGIVWLTLGLIFSSLIPVLGIVGFIGCIYYMFSGLDFVQKIDLTIGSPEDKLKEIDARIEEIKLNKSDKAAP